MPILGGGDAEGTMDLGEAGVELVEPERGYRRAAAELEDQRHETRQ
jgi:hypothetical protein